MNGRAGRSHIAMLAVDGTGARVAYRKMWLGTSDAAAGRSAIWSSDGVAVARAGSETGGIARATLR